WHVVGDVAVHAYPEDRDADAARVRDRALVADALGLEVGRLAVGDVAAVAPQSRPPPGVLLHERAERARIVPRQHDLVQVEAARACEVERARGMAGRQLVVERDRRAPGREGEDDLAL